MTTETQLQVCNGCGKEFAPRACTNPTNPLCGRCRSEVINDMRVYTEGIYSALRDRAEGQENLMARMSDERFVRYVLSQLEKFHAERARLG